MRESEFLIIGAGMAGASCAYWLAREHSVRLLEMESRPGYHTTGRSVAVYTEAYGPKPIRTLAKSGYEFFTRPPDGFTDIPLSHPHAWIFVARKDQRNSLETGLQAIQDLSPQIKEIDAEQAIRMVPVIRSDYIDSAIYEPTTLALDVNAIHQGFLHGTKTSGGEVLCDSEALHFERKGSKWHVKTRENEYVAEIIINAAGAWADIIAERIGARSIGLQPKRRTIVAFQPSNVAVDNDWPMVFDIDEQFYFKVDSGVVLGSPADETVVPAQDVQPEDLDVAIAIDRIETATTMEVRNIKRKWAGLRSFVADQVPVVGYDPRVDGYFWCAGQGGYGIETSYGMGRTSASLAVGLGLPEDIQNLGVRESDLSPDRLF